MVLMKDFQWAARVMVDMAVLDECRFALHAYNQRTLLIDIVRLQYVVCFRILQPGRANSEYNETVEKILAQFPPR